MKVKVRLFGYVAEQAGRRELSVEVAPPATVRSVLEAAKLALPKSVRAAVNTEYADRDAPVRSGDVVSVIPPVGGG